MCRLLEGRGYQILECWSLLGSNSIAIRIETIIILGKGIVWELWAFIFLLIKADFMGIIWMNINAVVNSIFFKTPVRKVTVRTII